MHVCCASSEMRRLLIDPLKNTRTGSKFNPVLKYEMRWDNNWRIL